MNLNKDRASGWVTSLEGIFYTVHTLYPTPYIDSVHPTAYTLHPYPHPQPLNQPRTPGPDHSAHNHTRVAPFQLSMAWQDVGGLR